MTRNIKETDYEEARREAYVAISTGIRTLAGIIDSLQEEIYGQPGNVRRLMEAYEHRLDENFMYSRGGPDCNSLAALQHEDRIYDKLVSMFEELALYDLDNEMTIRRIDILEEDRAKIKEMLGEFNSLYEDEISREAESEDYKNDQEIINKTMSGLCSATNGIWVPELIEVRNYMRTGITKAIEGPSSFKLSQIANQGKPQQPSGVPVNKRFALAELTS